MASKWSSIKRGTKEHKEARLGNDVIHRDSLVDAVGYLALFERIQK